MIQPPTRTLRPARSLPSPAMQGDYLRRATAEFVGTFAFVFIGCGSIAFARTFTDMGLAFGLAIAVMASAVGHISGAHFNPAVTLGFLVTRRMSPVLAGIYWIVQFGAAALAALLLHWALPSEAADRTHLGTPALGEGVPATQGPVTDAVTSGQGVIIEAVLTFFLAWVIFATAADPRG